VSYILKVGSSVRAEESGRVAAALQALGIERLLLTVHDASFPLSPGEDLGRGSPYSESAARFLAFVRRLGFTGVQLGPQGKTTPFNPSPFDGTLFARSASSIALQPLTRPGSWQGILPAGLLDRLSAGRPPGSESRVAHAYAWQAQQEALAAAFAGLRAREPDDPLAAGQARFAEANDWLADDGLYEALSYRHGSDDWRRWPATPGVPVLDAAEQEVAARNAFAQFVAHHQHRDLRARAADLGLKLYGDLQVGTSLRDLWAHRGLFLADHVMGAPPSRTNPEGQPWGYPVLDPAGYLADGPGAAFFRARLDKALAEFDGLRIDHPHGLCDPWVYRADVPDPLAAVQTGARLHSSPRLDEHPTLEAFAIARSEQLDPTRPRYADDWVRVLEPAQVARYATLFDVLLDSARRHGRDRQDIASEVLSTCPFPLAQVLQRHGLGRFRVTQKADPLDPADPYRTARAAPDDWVMLGTHDTPPIWTVLADWTTARVAAWARYLAERLAPAGERERFAVEVARDRGRLATALFADLFVGPARQVSVFFPDLFGLREVYNRPGVVDPANWSLRVPADWEQAYAAGCRSRQALDMRAALVLALRARVSGSDGGEGDLTALAAALEKDRLSAH
jgi:4-alpha-glucanotransferase